MQSISGGADDSGTVNLKAIRYSRNVLVICFVQTYLYCRVRTRGDFVALDLCSSEDRTVLFKISLSLADAVDLRSGLTVLPIFVALQHLIFHGMPAIRLRFDAKPGLGGLL